MRKFEIKEEVTFTDGFGRKYEAKIKSVNFDPNINQHHYSFEDITPINHNPSFDFVPKTTTKDTILEIQITKI